ncbi:Rieske (2Fe-2S) protein [Amphritea sp.]|uniref:Rieske (2Fe-2S) protein n=1 Tax=Amphritea sp. TaxID=1872502 RepID=UPI0025C73572|nr:Rieske (2Fe-2S) protein [Amphritea sp.]
MTTTTLLCQLSELPEHGAKGFDLEQRKLFAVKRQGEVFLYENRCPHQGIPLEWMPDVFLDAEKHFIQCSTHGALFTIDQGQCIAGPCIGAKLQTIAFEIIDGALCIQT